MQMKSFGIKMQKNIKWNNTRARIYKNRQTDSSSRKILTESHFDQKTKSLKVLCKKIQIQKNKKRM